MRRIEELVARGKPRTEGGSLVETSLKRLFLSQSGNTHVLDCV